MKRILFAAALAAVVASLALHHAGATVLTTSNAISYTGNGATTVFSVPFKILTASDLLVRVDGVAKTLTTHYSVSGVGTTSTAVTFLAAPANGAVVLISRVRGYAQITKLRGQRDYSPSTIEDALDNLEMQIQQIVGSDGGALSGLPGNNGVWAGSPAATFLGDENSDRGNINLVPIGSAPLNASPGDLWLLTDSTFHFWGSDLVDHSVVTDRTAVLAPATSVTTASVTATSVNASYVIFADATGPFGAPTTGVRFYGDARGAGFVLPSWRAVGEADVTQPPGMSSNWMPHCAQAIAGQTTFSGSNFWNAVFFGTPTARTPAAGSLVASLQGLDNVTAAGAGSSAGFYSTAPAFVFRGDFAGGGGFFFYTRFATTTALAQQRAFVGLTATVGAALANANPSTLLNDVYIGYDSTQTTLRACGNDGAGTATCTDLGATFPVSVTAVYDVWIYSPPAGTSVKWAVERLDVSAFASGTISAAGDLPSTSTFLAPMIWVNNGTTASAATMRVSKACITSRF